MATPPPPPQVGGTHYSEHNGPQPIELIEAMSLGFHDGNALKYIVRYSRTANTDDLRKAIWYIERLIDLEEAKKQPPPQEEESMAAYEPTNVCEADADAARRFAGEILKLEAGLKDLGLKPLDSYSVDRAPVASALHYLAEMKEHNRELTSLVHRPRLSEPF